MRTELQQQWDRNEEGFAGRTLGMLSRVTTKAWRFAGEMHEIAETFDAAGLPQGFQHAAADIYSRLSHLKDAQPRPPRKR